MKVCPSVLFVACMLDTVFVYKTSDLPGMFTNDQKKQFTASMTTRTQKICTMGPFFLDTLNYI